jgi:hydrogenase maturation protein HypF
VAHTQVAPDAVICPACAIELRDPCQRRYRYPFTNCTHCGPRLSIVNAIPYDRATTTMAGFALCAACRAEYGNPDDRRFHAEPIACPSCGPAAVLVALAGAPVGATHGDDIEVASGLIRGGAIVAIKGLGGYHLACDATNATAVRRLRHRKRRNAKPFALMARDLAVVRRYCAVDAGEERELTGVGGPIVLLRAAGPEQLPDAVAPGLDTLGFMLPTTPLHLLLLQDIESPLVMTSGNLSDEPPIIDDAETRRRLGGIAGYALMHNRDIANRVDDSVVRLMDSAPRVLRRARGFAPGSVRLPSGFEAAPELLAMGAELKATFCLVKDGQAILSQHQGDLEHETVFDDYRKSLGLYRRLFDHAPAALAIDRHPEYLSAKLGRSEAEAHGLPLIEVQHHHAHVAACLAENGHPLEAPAVLGIVLDGLGLGDDGTLWGGEFLLADYRGYQRLARLKPVAMPGGAQAVREPWRNLYAHLAAAIGWHASGAHYSGLDLHTYLSGKPCRALAAMITSRLNAPLASSCGRLFDAVAAALDVCRERQAYEGEAAARLETLAAAAAADERADLAYTLGISAPTEGGLRELDPAPMWRALLFDLADGVAVPTMARRFHRGLALTLVAAAERLAQRECGFPRFDTVALSGGCFQNRLLFESVAAWLREAGFRVLTHREVPTNDGGLSLGQAAIGAATLLGRSVNWNGERATCVSASPAVS